MRVLIVKMSSLGDIIHTLPAITDAAYNVKDIKIDWVVEEAYADILDLHKHIDKVIPCKLRLWRKKPFYYKKEWLKFKEDLLSTRYDLVIDAQGLLKSAFIVRQVSAPSAGYSYKSCTESISMLAYDYKYFVPNQQHIINKTRGLFALALKYTYNSKVLDYGLKVMPESSTQNKYLIFAHGTTWKNKYWPYPYWRVLAKIAHAEGIQVKLPWGNELEKEQAEKVAAGLSNTSLLPKTSLKDMAQVISKSTAVIGVDTGFVHLAAALDIPSIELFGATDAQKVGGIGQKHIIITSGQTLKCMPCWKRKCTHKDADTYATCMHGITPARVWKLLQMNCDLH
jgi:heptosyltransferase I